MSRLGPSRSHHALVLVLWLSMMLLIWQHYHGLGQVSGGQINKAKARARVGTQPEDDKDVEGTSSIKLPADSPQRPQHPIAPSPPNGIEALLASIAKSSEYFVNVVLQPSDSKKLGGRLQILSTWLSARETLPSLMSSSQISSLDNYIERTIISLFPFTRHPAQPKNAQPFTTLRQTFQKGSIGIVIVGDKSNLRYLCHAIQNIRSVHKSSIPIQVAHAGDNALSPSLRRFITRLASDITTVNIPTFLDSHSLDLEKEDAAPALRPFAALASTFEQVILVDPKTIFLQTPHTILENHSAYKATGALFFHDHLYGKGDFRDRHVFWQGQLKNHPHSQALRSSKVYNEGYAEEADGGVIVLDKSRTSVMVGLLHTCWQNSKRVRKDFTYKYGSGDRDSWWLGFELAGAPYSWENQYGGTIGTLERREGKEDRVCGNTNLHLDENDKPLWFSGGLVYRMEGGDDGGGKGGYEAMTHWIVDGVFLKKAEAGGKDCMKGDSVRAVGREAEKVIRESMEAAKKVDEKSRVFDVRIYQNGGKGVS
ncbi:MAG: hypothetical protein Q9209_002578 [Squamulea sp. 1 TL-2023]